MKIVLFILCSIFTMHISTAQNTPTDRLVVPETTQKIEKERLDAQAKMLKEQKKALKEVKKAEKIKKIAKSNL